MIYLIDPQKIDLSYCTTSCPTLCAVKGTYPLDNTAPLSGTPPT